MGLVGLNALLKSILISCLKIYPQYALPLSKCMNEMKAAVSSFISDRFRNPLSRVYNSIATFTEKFKPRRDRQGHKP